MKSIKEAHRSHKTIGNRRVSILSLLLGSVIKNIFIKLDNDRNGIIFLSNFTIW
jgi:hypothetical protein